MITHIILDLDGTLYEKGSVTEYALKKFAKEKELDFGLVINKSKEAEEIVLKTNNKFNTHQEFFNEAYKQMLPLIGLENNSDNIQLIKDLIELAKQEILLNISPRIGVKDFLDFIQSKNLKIIVFSGGHPIKVIVDPDIRNKNYMSDLRFKEKQIINLGLRDYFDEIIPSSQFGGYKPQKEVFVSLLDHLGCKGENCIMIGDSGFDVASNQVGIKSILLGDKDSTPWIPDYRANDFSKILEIVKNLL